MKDIEDYLSGIIRDMQDEIDLLEHQIRQYRKALEFYAMSGQAIGETKHGEVARKALEGEE